MINNEALVYDIECDSLDVEKAKIKKFGAYSYKFNRYYTFNGSEINNIKSLFFNHNVLIGFNNKEFDNIIIKNNINIEFGPSLIIIDLYEISRKRFKNMKLNIKKLSLDNITKVLNISDKRKGEIDYDLFKKDETEWTAEENEEINTYLLSDIEITKDLYEWYEKTFSPLKELLSVKDQKRYKHLTTSIASLSYHIVCHKAGLKLEWSNEKKEGIKVHGGHHIKANSEIERGNIVNIDFTSFYPNIIIMFNLFDGSDKELGKIESVVKEIFLLRYKAKREKDVIKNNAYKLVINAIYGITNCYKFKSTYNPQVASNCTMLGRSILKRLAKTLDENGFIPLYGFTDNIFVKIPQQSNKDELMHVVRAFTDELKNTFPFVRDTFGVELDKEIKFAWFVCDNTYLWVYNNNQLEYTDSLINSNISKLTKRVFDDYIKPKIIKELDVRFSSEEIINEIHKIIKEDINKNIELCAKEYNAKEKETYKVKTGIQYQIASTYGEGTHLLIPNLKNIGVGKAKSTSKKIGVRYCTVDEFKANNLNEEDIDYSKIVGELKRFIR